ncbi:MAG: class II aldolase/adducin family protein, partial [Chloroflexi bacterium]|nr:class II aldolase/adducin family protein [Chloroflexota bacterium]
EPSSGAAMIPLESRARMGRIIADFVERLRSDESLRAAAAGKDVALRFVLADAGLSFHLTLCDGVVSAGTATPDRRADVELKMPAAILDGMFTGAVNAMDAALNGRLSFTGDTVKAMALQELQADLSRLYSAAREEIGDPGDLSPVRDLAAGTESSRLILPVAAGDVREDVVQVVNELYAAELITATGGNVSVRVPGAAGELWITPSQLFKGQLRPEMLVRIDLDGRPLDDSTLPPSSERLMHCAVYRARSDATAVIHAHAPHATILANAGLPFLPISTEAAFFGDIPRVPFIMPGTEELARAIGEAMRGAWAVLMRNHGLLVAGRTLRRAADMVEIIDRSAEVILGCYAVGKEPPTLPAEVVTQLQQLGDLLA